MSTIGRIFSAACLVAATGPVSAAPVASADWTRAYYYQFERAAEGEGQTVQGRLEYVAGGKVLYQKRALFRSTGPGPVTLVVQDPLALVGAGEFRDLRIQAFVADVVVASFDVAAFRAYNRKLRNSQARALAEAYAAHTFDDDRLTGSGDVGERFEVSQDARASALSAVTCQAACQSDYRECTQTCWGQGCQQCPRLRTECLAACTTDTDGDGLIDTADNCPTTPNPSQANCDGDSRGDACDVVNATYVHDPQVFTCKTDRDEHLLYDTIEHHVETRDYDTSACHAPDIWNQSIRADRTCYDFNGSGDNSLYGCCLSLSSSLTAVGGPYSVEEWCTAPRFDHDYCHR